MSNAVATNPLSVTFEREIERFIKTASLADHEGLYRNRRATSRVHRAMPILFMRLDGGNSRDHSATLHNVSSDGLAFHCDCGLQVGAVLAIKLFWSDINSSRVPAIVRHCEITQQGFLIGAQFATHHPEACDLIQSSREAWYG